VALTPEQIANLAEFAGLVATDDGKFRDAEPEELEDTRSPLIDWKNSTVERLTTTAEFLKKVDRTSTTYAKRSKNSAAKRGVILLNSIYTGG